MNFFGKGEHSDEQNIAIAVVGATGAVRTKWIEMLEKSTLTDSQIKDPGFENDQCRSEEK